VLVTVDLDSNSEKPRSIEIAELIKPMGNPPTPAEGTGMARVRKTEPVPLPQHTLPATHTGFKTLDNPYSHCLLPLPNAVGSMFASVSKFNGVGGVGGARNTPSA